MEKRIWELDLLRGVFLIGMIAVHLIDDLVYMFGLMDLSNPALSAVYTLCTNWGGVLFILLSGICASFSTRTVRRGLIVLGGGLIVSAVSVGMYVLDLSDKSIIIYFGILHCLGVCMLLWPLFRALPGWALMVLGVALAATGLYFDAAVRLEFDYLAPLGLFSRSFATADYFPLLPNLGYFLVGGALGKWLYPHRKTLFPKVNDANPLIRFFTFLGRNSLLIYLLHQPLLAAIVWLWDALA